MNMTLEEKINYYKNVDKDEINYIFVNECEKGNIDIIRYLLTDKEIKDKFNIDINYNKSQGLKKACENNHIELVKYLLTSTELKKHADITLGHNTILNFVCEKGYLELVKFFLTHPKFKNKANVNFNEGSYDYPFIEACKSNNIELVKYLLTSSDLQEKAKINREDNEGLTGFIFACYNGNKELVEYMLYSPELKEHANIYAYDKKFKINGFGAACLMGKTEVVDYLYEKERDNLIKDHQVERAFSRCVEQMLQSSKELMKEMIAYIIFNTHLTLTKALKKDLDKKLIVHPEERQIIIELFERKRLKESLDNNLNEIKSNRIKNKI